MPCIPDVWLWNSYGAEVTGVESAQTSSISPLSLSLFLSVGDDKIFEQAHLTKIKGNSEGIF